MSYPVPHGGVLGVDDEYPFTGECHVLHLTPVSLPWLQGVEVAAMSHRVEDAGAVLGATHGQVELGADVSTNHLAVVAVESLKWAIQ